MKRIFMLCRICQSEIRLTCKLYKIRKLFIYLRFYFEFNFKNYSGLKDGYNWTKTEFETTKNMSTYLVAILVSDYECENGNADTPLSGKVDVAVCVRPNAFNQIDFAVESAKYFIAFFEEYFNIKYPLPKLGKI